jgi:hypothetical protein
LALSSGLEVAVQVVSTGAWSATGPSMLVSTRSVEPFASSTVSDAKGTALVPAPDTVMLRGVDLAGSGIPAPARGPKSPVHVDQWGRGAADNDLRRRGQDFRLWAGATWPCGY